MQNPSTQREFIASIDDANALIFQMEIERGVPHAEFIEHIDSANGRIEFLSAFPVLSSAAPTAGPLNPTRGQHFQTPPPPPRPAVVTEPQHAAKPTLPMVWQPVGLGRAIIAASGGSTLSTQPPKPPKQQAQTGLARAIAAAEAQASR